MSGIRGAAPHGRDAPRGVRASSVVPATLSAPLVHERYPQQLID